MIARAKGPRVLVLVKRTSWGTLVEEKKDAHIKALVARGDASVRRMRRSHEAHEETVREVKEALAAVGARMEFLLGPRSKVESTFDLVITVGGDGTLLAASHQVGHGVPLLGVNSAPESSVGFFCAARKGNVKDTLALALDGSLARVDLARMRVDINDRCVHKRVLNEALFCHSLPAATSRYILRVFRHTRKAKSAPEEEEQKSSGLWIGPAAGSTAALRSAGGKVLPLTSHKIQFVVREPYVRLGTKLALPTGLIGEDGKIVIHSKMNEARLFLDGHHIVHHIVMGDVLTMQRSDESLTVLGLRRPGLYKLRSRPDPRPART
jgi:NAD+ kinase